MKDIKAYMKQARGQFCTGQLDIKSDKDWDAYVKTMYDMGLQTIIDNSHAAWTRQMAK